MLTYTTRRNLFGTLTSDSSAANLTVGDTLLNEADKEVLIVKPWNYRQKTKTLSTETANSHDLPADCGKVVNITVTIGTTKYSPRRIKTREDWDRITQSTATTSNTPEAYFLFGKTLSFYPAPSSVTTDAITVVYEREVKDLSIADYSTGSIVSIASAATTVTGTGTTWTASMAGRYIRITDSDTANKGDGYWYEIASVTSATVLELVASYAGTSIAAGAAAYVIGQTSIIPGDHQMTPVYRAVENYFSYISPDADRATKATQDYANGIRRMQVECGSLAT